MRRQEEEERGGGRVRRKVANKQPLGFISLNLIGCENIPQKQPPPPKKSLLGS